LRQRARSTTIGRVVTSRVVPALLLCAVALSIACSEKPTPAIKVERNRLTVDNRTDRDWLDVEIWINRQYRVTLKRVAARSRFTTTLDVFVAGFGQRFDIRRQRIDDLRLKAHEPNGTPVEHELARSKGGLAGALEGFGT